jgi:hypothetical protein
VSGTIAEITAVSGDRMLIGPMASAAYSVRIAIEPATPLNAPQSAASGDIRPSTNSEKTSSNARPTMAENATTRTGESRFEAMPPKKSAAP